MTLWPWRKTPSTEAVAEDTHRAAEEFHRQAGQLRHASAALERAADALVASTARGLQRGLPNRAAFVERRRGADSDYRGPERRRA